MEENKENLNQPPIQTLPTEQNPTPPVQKKFKLPILIAGVVSLVLIIGATSAYFINSKGGKFCGGIAAVQCPIGYTCRLDGKYPDAGGGCVKSIFSIPSKPSPTPPATDGPTANWKTYTNRIYGISIKYPPSYTMTKCGGESTSRPNKIGGTADGTETECVFVNNNVADPNTSSFITINFFNEPRFETIPEEDKVNGNKGNLTTIEGKRAYVTIHDISSGDTEKNKQVYIEISPLNNVSIVGRYNDTNSIALFDQILSTFKFTK